MGTPPRLRPEVAMLANVARRLEQVRLFQYCSELKRNNGLRKGTFPDRRADFVGTT